MKKVLIVFLISLLMLPLSVRASLGANISCGSTITDSDNEKVRECYVIINVTDNSKFYGLSGKFNLEEASVKSVEVADSKIKMIKKTDTTFEVASENAITNVTNFKVLKVVFKIESENCVIKIEPTNWEKIPNCIKLNDYYYNSSGVSVTENEYKEDCGLFSCEEYNGKYYNKTGLAVTENEYKLDCGKFSCETYNNKYYNNKY